MALHVLYRFFAADNTLLYIGITCNPGRRFDQHGDRKEWWSTVARIEMEQFPTRDALREAERAAIVAEKPKYNIRMNGVATTATTLTAESEETPPNGLVGRWFHTWRDATGSESEYATRRGDRVLEWQGEVIDWDDPAGMFIVQLLSWWDGCPSEQRLVSPEAMGEWTFYESALEMQCALGCRQSTETRDRCGNECSHIVWVLGSGTVVCYHCAAGWNELNEIEWRDGHPQLGKKLSAREAEELRHSWMWD